MPEFTKEWFAKRLTSQLREEVRIVNFVKEENPSGYVADVHHVEVCKLEDCFEVATMLCV